MNDSETSDQSSPLIKTSETGFGVKTGNYSSEGYCCQNTEEAPSCCQDTEEAPSFFQNTNEESGNETEIIPKKNAAIYVKKKRSSTCQRAFRDQTPPCSDLSFEADNMAKTNISFTRECNIVLARCDENTPRDNVVSTSVSQTSSDYKSSASKRKKNENNSHKVVRQTVQVFNDYQTVNDQVPRRKIASKSNPRQIMKLKDNDLEITEVITDPLACIPNDITSVSKRKKQKKNHTENKTIFVSNTAELLQIASSKEIKPNKEPTIVIIDTDSILSGKGPVPVSKMSLIDPFPRSPVVSGFSVFPAECNAWNIPSAIQTSLQNINHNIFATPKNSCYLSSQLSHLNTNDLYLIEAPSFIVPYLYVKIPEKSLKKYIEQLQKEKKIDSSMDDANDKNKQVSIDSDKHLKRNCEENNQITCSKFNGDCKFMYDVNQNSRIGSEVKVNGGITNNFPSIEHNSTRNIENSKSIPDNTSRQKEIGENQSKNCNHDYFNSPLGKFFLEIGNSLVKQYVHSDLINSMKINDTQLIAKSQLLQFYSNKFGINLEYNETDNKPFCFKIKKCVHCHFQTESTLVMAHHMDVPHTYNNVFKCNYCNVIIETQANIVYHMAKEHNRNVCLENSPTHYECPNCFYEDNRKYRIKTHMASCSKKFKPDQNQEPSSDWVPPGKIIHQPCIFPKRGKGTSYQLPSKGVRQILPKLPPKHYVGISPDQHSVYAALDQTATCQKFLNISKQVPITAALQRPNISITPLPNMQNTSSVNVRNSPQNVQENFASLLSKYQNLYICEICDSCFQNLSELRTHFQCSHHEKFPKQTLLTKPSLKCPKCSLCFFTYHGLERHLLGIHGLVTSRMEEEAENEKDGDVCPRCGKFFKNKLLYHFSIEHKIKLKKISITYKCTLCQNETFKKYEHFENHVSVIHNKREIRKHSEISDHVSNDLKSQNDDSEITIISHIKPNLDKIGVDHFSTHKSQRSKKIERSSSMSKEEEPKTELNTSGDKSQKCSRYRNMNNSEASNQSNLPTKNKTESCIQNNNQNEAQCKINTIDKCLIDKEDLIVNDSLRKSKNKNVTEKNKCENLKAHSHMDTSSFKCSSPFNDMEGKRIFQDSGISQQQDDDIEVIEPDENVLCEDQIKQKEK